jgi:hypothetical protein
MASFGAVTVMMPPVILRSSLLVIPFLYEALTVKAPLPLMVRSLVQ